MACNVLHCSAGTSPALQQEGCVDFARFFRPIDPRQEDAALYFHCCLQRNVECTPCLRHETRNWLRLLLAARAVDNVVDNPQAVTGWFRTRRVADSPAPSAVADDCTRLQ